MYYMDLFLLYNSTNNPGRKQNSFRPFKMVTDNWLASIWLGIFENCILILNQGFAESKIKKANWNLGLLSH